MTEANDLKLLLKELSKKDVKLLIDAWMDCLKQGYLEVFPDISKKTFDRELQIEDYEEYILGKEELIEDRYAKYWRMMFELNRSDFDKDNCTKVLYKSLLLESLDRFSIELKENKITDKKRGYIFSNQYLLGQNHSPTIIIDKIKESLANYLDEIYIISTTPYPYPYPDNYFQAFSLSGIEENTVYSISEKIYLVEFRGYLSESMYFDFVQNQNLSNEDLFILVGHSSIHFDILPFNKKIYIPTTHSISSLSTAKNIVLSGDVEYRNIFDEKMHKLSATNDLTLNNSYYHSKDIQNNENIYVAIIGNRLNKELDKVFFEQLNKMYIKNNRLKFVIIGKFTNKEKVPQNISNRMEYFTYIDNLSEFLGENIHFYLNPERLGGGQSAIISINVNVPVITLKNCDVHNNLYKKYGINSLKEAINFINDYMYNKTFKEKIDKFNIEIQELNKENFNKSIEEIIGIKGQ